MTRTPQDGRDGSGVGDEAEEPTIVDDDRAVDRDAGETGYPGSAAQAGPGADAAAAAAEAVADDAAASASGEAEGGDAVDVRVAELTGDLQRLQAEYANYRKREQRERQVAIAKAKASVIGELLELLDDLDRAREHGDLESGPLKSIADKFDSALNGLGLEGFGEAGEPFDPEQHEAVQHSGQGDTPVLDTVLRRGYKVGDRVLRTAMVIVGDGPADGSGPDASGAGDSASGSASTESGGAGDDTAG